MHTVHTDPQENGNRPMAVPHDHWRTAAIRRDLGIPLVTGHPAHDSFAAHPCPVETVAASYRDQTANRAAIDRLIRHWESEVDPMGAPTGLETLLAIGEGRNASRSYEARS